MARSALILLLAAAFSLLSHPALSEVDISWVTVDNAGNACDPQVGGCFGSVAAPYRTAKFEVSNAEYTEFLNAVAATDTNGLYATNMADPTQNIFGYGGITRTGSSGNYSYGAIAGRANMPVNHVSFYDGLRFANWLHNGKPTGAQTNSTTEDGAYTITPAGISANSIVRNAGAEIFLPSEDEWHKAAYFNGTSYFEFPAGTDAHTVCAAPGATANTANCLPGVGDLTDVGSYTGSAKPLRHLRPGRQPLGVERDNQARQSAGSARRLLRRHGE